MKKTAAAIALTVLAGCAIGIQENGGSPRVSYEVDRSYQTVHDRAVAQADECLRGDDSGFDGRRENRDVRGSAFVVKQHLDQAARSGEITVSDPMTGAVVARTRLQAVSANRTAVTQEVWGRGSWNGKTLNAMRRSIEMDASVCTVYKVD